MSVAKEKPGCWGKSWGIEDPSLGVGVVTVDIEDLLIGSWFPSLEVGVVTVDIEDLLTHGFSAS